MLSYYIPLQRFWLPLIEAMSLNAQFYVVERSLVEIGGIATFFDPDSEDDST